MTRGELNLFTWHSSKLPYDLLFWWKHNDDSHRLATYCSCWDDTDKVGIWWIIKGPITASLLVSICTSLMRMLPWKSMSNFLRKSQTCILFLDKHLILQARNYFTRLFLIGQHRHLHQRDQDSGSEAQIFSHGRKQRHRTFHVRERFPVVPRMLGNDRDQIKMFLLKKILDFFFFRICISNTEDSFRMMLQGDRKELFLLVDWAR